jgi:hypothetical protein
VKKMYRFNVHCGRQGDLAGLFVADSEEVDRAMGKSVFFDEPFGKHSAVTVTLAPEHFTVATDDQDFIAKFEALKIGSQGDCPLGILHDQELDGAAQ